MKVLKFIAIGSLVLVAVFLVSVGVGYFVGKSPQFEDKMNALVEEKDQRDKEAYESLSDEKKKEINDAVFEAFAEGMQRREAAKIASVEADGTKVVLTLPSFINESLLERMYVCTTSAPSDFRQQISKFTDDILVAREPYLAFQAEHPDCYENSTGTNYFIYENSACNVYRPQDRELSKELNLLLEPAQGYVNEYCEYYY